ncbi:hypothetical protein BAE44_0008126, partial [Dichanthelium oligosanthes]
YYSFHGVRCYATQTQNVQRKSSTATIKRADPKGKTLHNLPFWKVNGPKLDDGNGGFPPFRFGKGRGAEKNLLQQGHGSGDQASIGLAQ